MKNINNIAGYKFIKLEQLQILQSDLKAYCAKLNLKGTILIAPEGINIMLAGEEENVRELVNYFAQDQRFADIEFKSAYSDFIPFKRLLIKIKQQIIAFNNASINPAEITAPNLSPVEFKDWLDSNKEITILDVRNDCEIKHGTFKRAINLNLKDFRSFPKAIDEMGSALKQKPLVMFCTGGIRCEKASAYLLEQGFNDIYQLQGGILKYFTECGAAHYEGGCFVFDQRVTVTPN